MGQNLQYCQMKSDVLGQNANLFTTRVITRHEAHTGERYYCIYRMDCTRRQSRFYIDLNERRYACYRLQTTITKDTGSNNNRLEQVSINLRTLSTTIALPYSLRLKYDHIHLGQRNLSDFIQTQQYIHFTTFQTQNNDGIEKASFSLKKKSAWTE